MATGERDPRKGQTDIKSWLDISQFYAKRAATLGNSARVAGIAAEEANEEFFLGLKDISAQLQQCVVDRKAGDFEQICIANGISFGSREVDSWLNLPSADAESPKLFTSKSANFGEGDKLYVRKGFEPVVVTVDIDNGDLFVTFTSDHPILDPEDEQVSIEPCLYDGVITDPVDILNRLRDDFEKLSELSGGDEQIKDIHLHNWLNTATQALNDIDDAYSNEAFDDATQGRLFWMIHDFKNLLLDVSFIVEQQQMPETEYIGRTPGTIRK